MRLYICIDGTFAGTQADANAKGKGWTQVEVPTDKGGLIDYLNGMVSEARGGTDASLFNERPAPIAPPPAAPVTFTHQGAPGPQDGAEAIADWYYREASEGDVYDLFTTLSSRFSDAVRAART